MKTLIKIAFFSILLLVANQQTIAQSNVYVDVAQVFSKFKFSSATNNEAPGSGYSTITNTSFGFGYQYANQNGLLLLGGLNIRKAGSALIVNKVNYSWNLQYIDIKAGVGYQYNKYRIKPYVVVAPSYSYLLNANQNVGLNYFDIKSTQSIKTSDFSVFFTGGLNIDLSRYFSIFVDYNYILGLNNIETGEGQFLYNRAFALRGGLLFNISAVAEKPMYVVHDTIIQPQATLSNANPTKTVNGTSITTTGNIASQQSNQIKSVDNQQSNQTKSLESQTNNDGSDTQANQKDITKNNTDVLANNQQQEQTKNNASQPYKLSEQQLQKISKVASAQNITFKIQLIALKNELDPNHSLLKNVSGDIKKEKGEDGFYRYYTGTYSSYEKALEELKKIKEGDTAKDAFIVAFQEGKKITVSDAKKIVN